MLELSGLPKKYHATVFNTPSGATTLGWQSWTKPRGFTMCMMHVVGGGGGGGNGFTRATLNQGGGGGGGAGAAMCKLLVPMAMLPNSLYVLCGAGGAATATGISSYISVLPNTTTRNVFIFANGGGGGGTGTGGAGGAAGSAPATPSAASARLSAAGFFYAVTGPAGGAGNATTTGANGNSMSTGSGTSGGAGGAGVTAGNATANGGQLANSTEWLYTIAGGVAPSGRGNDGLAVQLPNCSDGVNAYIPTLSLAGTGGASGGTVVGGNGGDGGPGSGGGGGGAGTTGGTGGRGGDGFVVIICW